MQVYEATFCLMNIFGLDFLNLLIIQFNRIFFLSDIWYICRPMKNNVSLSLLCFIFALSPKHHLGQKANTALIKV